MIFYWFRLLSTRPIFANQAQYFWYSSSLTNHSFRSNCSSLISGISFTSETVQKSQKLKSGSCVSLQTLSQRNTLKHLLWKKTQLDPSVLVHPLNCNKKIQVQGKWTCFRVILMLSWTERDKVRHCGIGDESRARALWADQGLYTRN